MPGVPGGEKTITGDKGRPLKIFKNPKGGGRKNYTRRSLRFPGTPRQGKQKKWRTIKEGEKAIGEKQIAKRSKQKPQKRGGKLPETHPEIGHADSHVWKGGLPNNGKTVAEKGKQKILG